MTVTAPCVDVVNDQALSFAAMSSYASVLVLLVGLLLIRSGAIRLQTRRVRR